MMRFNLKKLEVICKAGIAISVLAVVVLAALYIAQTGDAGGQATGGAAAAVEPSAGEDGQLQENFYPKSCTVDWKMPDIAFQTADGGTLALRSLEGKTVILDFWASWCPRCQENLKESDALQQMLNGYDDVVYYLVDKTDGDRETKKTALDYLETNGIGLITLLDSGASVYTQLGVQTMPTALVIDKNGFLRACLTGSSAADHDALKNALETASRPLGGKLSGFITDQLTNQYGALRTSYLPEGGGIPSGDDVLSESQGMMMEYAVLTGDRELFDLYWNYADRYMRNDPLTAWVLTKKETIRTNSTLDDMRIFYALFKADTLWGGYGETAEEYAGLIYRYNVRNFDQLVSFYDFKNDKKASTLSLCYADFQILKQLKQLDERWAPVYETCLSIVEGGLIGDSFPLYYGGYDYQQKSYVENDINMAEEMQTLLNLAREGRLQSATVEWLRSAIADGGICGRYTVRGETVPGYEYDSTAVYALVVQIARVIEDDDLGKAAFEKMRGMEISDTSGGLAGAFGNPDGTCIYSFDQLQALFAYDGVLHWDEQE